MSKHVPVRRLSGRSKDLTGMVSGKLTVESFSRWNGKYNLWNCRCLCGRLIEVRASHLTDGGKTACSKACIYEDLTGKTTDHFKVLRRADRKGTQYGNFWECQCLICGTTTVIASRNINWGVGCKACQKLPDGGSAFNALFYHYRASAIKRGFAFTLTRNDCAKLFKGNCSYCGRIPQQARRVNSSTFIYNGIDRMDSKIGYVPGNVTPCCKVCNLRKGKMNVAQFKEWIDLVHRTMESNPALLGQLTPNQSP